mmetsp:Transcript_90503/g.242715  ORF Transcript_90503/g.242715 Transcript_90503/m.242715 type:complete len:191 (+) Transcript_90503:1-573(+)
MESEHPSAFLDAVGHRSSIKRHHAAIRDSIAMEPCLEPRSGIIGRVKNKIFPQAELLTQHEFKNKIASFEGLSMPDEEIDILFSVLDSDGSGTVTYQKITDLLAALAPEQVLRAMDLDDEDDNVSASESSGDEEKEEKEDCPSESGFGGNVAWGLAVLQEWARTWPTSSPLSDVTIGNDRSVEADIKVEL